MPYYVKSLECSVSWILACICEIDHDEIFFVGTRNISYCHFRIVEWHKLVKTDSGVFLGLP